MNRRSFTVALATSFAACEELQRRPSGIDRIFSGFEFVESFPAEDLLLESHRHEGEKLPKNFVANAKYAFHLEQDRDFEEIPVVLFPNRLRSVGATVISAPDSWRDMGIPNTGNPIWVIEFSQGAYRGYIRNHFDRNRREQFAESQKLRHNIPDPRIDDYVLSLEILR
jgi:hypothetical protein